MRDIMRYLEYGGSNQRTVMLLHGGGLAPWNYRKAAEKKHPKAAYTLGYMYQHGLGVSRDYSEA